MRVEKDGRKGSVNLVLGYEWLIVWDDGASSWEDGDTLTII